MTDITYRPATSDDAAFLRRMLAEAFNWRGDSDFDPAVLNRPEVSHYIDGWMTATDFGVIAERSGHPAGAAWARFLPASDRGYGYVADDIPELTLAVAPEHRGNRIGPALLEALVNQGRRLDLPGISLSVEDGNLARKLYHRQGFIVVGRNGDSDTLLKRFRP
ncbi:GNAT family N-acetyltransferase [uncultured Corynebacterium sp.]|uniref:GNAT family N-acetyltransferase n=1 Tax=uncultured Corynebacterium sp. TaxID=159447 RepID=UPI0025FAFA8B|nr:GNAT family N-acetyltransferase [uncultured Corynebacterium sp.]